MLPGLMIIISKGFFCLIRKAQNLNIMCHATLGVCVQLQKKTKMEKKQTNDPRIRLIRTQDCDTGGGRQNKNDLDMNGECISKL